MKASVKKLLFFSHCIHFLITKTFKRRFKNDKTQSPTKPFFRFLFLHFLPACEKKYHRHLLNYNLAYIYFIFTQNPLQNILLRTKHISKKRSRNRRMPRQNCRRNWNRKWRKIETRNKRKRKVSEACNLKNVPLRFPVAGNGATLKTQWTRRWLRRLSRRRQNSSWAQHWGTF